MDGKAFAVGRRQGLQRLDLQTGLTKPAPHLVVGETQTAMLVLLAQELQAMRGEVDDQEAAAGRHEARRLGHRGGGIG